MEYQFILNLVFGAIFFLAGWVIRVLWDTLSALKEDMSDLERYASNTYIRRDDYHQDMDDIKKTLARIELKMDQKADK